MAFENPSGPSKDPAPRTRKFSVDGVELRYEVRGSGPPLLLLHGFMGCLEDFRHVFDLDELARHHSIIRVDLRGHGGSTGIERFSHRACGGDVIALLDHLGIARCQAFGVSAGGNTLLHVATRAPERLEAMVIAGSPSYFPKEARAIMAMVSEDAQSDEEWRVMRERHLHGDAQIRAIWRQARAFKDSYDDMNFTPPLLATITARTLIITGDRDPLYPVQIFVDMYRAIPNASLFVVPGAGHAPVFGAHRAEVERVARDFFTNGA